MNIKQLKEVLEKALSEGVSPETPITILSGDMNAMYFDMSVIYEVANINLINSFYHADNSPKASICVKEGISLVLLAEMAILHEDVMTLHEYTNTVVLSKE